LDIRKLIKTLLFIFVGLSFAVLIYKEFSPRNESFGNEIAATQGKAVASSSKSASVPVNRALEKDAVKPQNSVPSPQTAMKAHNARVVVYYFHGTFRCSTCRTIEKYSHDAIQQYFSKELGDGKLEFKPVNVEESENRHFIQDYQLFSKSLVLSLVRDSKETKSKNLTDIWSLVSDKEKFFQYVKDEVEKFIKET